MKIHNLFCGGYASNCYYVTDNSGKYAVIIDPSVSPDKVKANTQAEICAVLLTHTHYDHMMYLNEWRATGVPLAVSKVDAYGLGDARYNASSLFGFSTTYEAADRLLSDGDTILFGDEELHVIMTPGHTAGGCCYYAEGVLFSGDTLFAEGGIGRYDLPGGSYVMLEDSLAKILSLPADTQVYPGHGGPTRIEAERRYHII